MCETDPKGQTTCTYCACKRWNNCPDNAVRAVKLSGNRESMASEQNRRLAKDNDVMLKNLLKGEGGRGVGGMPEWSMAVVIEKLQSLEEILNEGQKQICWAVVQFFGRQEKRNLKMPRGWLAESAQERFKNPPKGERNQARKKSPVRRQREIDKRARSLTLQKQVRDSEKFWPRPEEKKKLEICRGLCRPISNRKKHN